jgi:hypothetical protein
MKEKGRIYDIFIIILQLNAYTVVRNPYMKVIGYISQERNIRRDWSIKLGGMNTNTK